MDSQTARNRTSARAARRRENERRMPTRGGITAPRGTGAGDAQNKLHRIKAGIPLSRIPAFIGINKAKVPRRLPPQTPARPSEPAGLARPAHLVVRHNVLERLVHLARGARRVVHHVGLRTQRVTRKQVRARAGRRRQAEGVVREHAHTHAPTAPSTPLARMYPTHPHTHTHTHTHLPQAHPTAKIRQPAVLGRPQAAGPTWQRT